jgi:hypothetical protein
MSKIVSLILIAFVSISASAEMPKAECKKFKKEHKMILLDMTRDEAFCIAKRAKLTTQYVKQEGPDAGKLVEIYQKNIFLFGLTSFAIIEDKVVYTSKI